MALSLYCRSRAGRAPGDGRWGGHWLISGSVGGILLGILLLLVALAYASPPDPSWIHGIYDDHDDDDVVAMVTDATGVTDSQIISPVNRAPARFVHRAVAATVAMLTARLLVIRGPPMKPRDVVGGLLQQSHAMAPTAIGPPVFDSPPLPDVESCAKPRRKFLPETAPLPLS